MKKQTTGGRKKLWLILGVIGLVLVAAVSAVLIFRGTDGARADDTDGKIYWNIDRNEYLVPGTVDTVHATCRPKRDGVYVVRMSVDGEQVNVKVKDALTVQRMDNWDLMGLVFDEEGYVVDMVKPDDLPGTVLQDVYISAMEGETLTVNTSPFYNALERRITVTDQAKVYNVANYDGSGLLTGMEGSLSVDDRITVVFDESGAATHVFTEPYWVPGDIYYNLERCYDSASQLTTRQSDVLGYYNFRLALNGQIVEARTKDLKLATEIDKQGYMWVGLQFDENGDISAVTSAGKAAHGKGACMNTNVRSIEQTAWGLQVTCLSVATGASNKVNLHPDCKIYDFSGSQGQLGQETQLKEGDYIRCVQDHRGRIVYVAVVYRPGVAQYAYILDKNYDSNTRQTGRTPDAEGWYHIQAAVGGKTVTLRSSNKNDVNYIDSMGTGILGLRLDGDVILGTAPAAYTLAGYYLCSGWDVTALDLESLTMEVTSMSGTTKGQVLTGKLSENCVVYNISPMATVKGEIDQVQTGDTVRAYTNYKGEVEAIYVTKRPMHSSVYRKLKDLGLQDGYYHYLMAVDGRQITVKASGAAAVQLNKSKTLGLYLNSDNVTYKAVSAVEVAGCDGGSFAQDYTVVGISGGNLQLSKSGNALEAPLAAGYRVYDVASGGDRAGRATDIRYGDVVQCFKNKGGQITLIYVLKRESHRVSSHCACYGAEFISDHSTCKKLSFTKLPAAKDYKITITQSGSYYLSADVSAAITVEKGLEVNLCLNGYTLQARQAITVLEGATLNISDCTGEGRIASTHETNGGYSVKVDGGSVNLYSGSLLGVQTNDPSRSNRCVLLASGSFTMYGGKISGGFVKDSKNGGNVLVQSGSFTVLGGEISGGAVTGGKGADVYIAQDAHMVFGGSARVGQIYVAGQLQLHQQLDVTKAQAKIGLEDLTARFGVGNALESYESVFTSLIEGYTVRYDQNQKALYLRSNIVHAHSVCVGSDGDHTGCESAQWEPVPAVKDNKITITQSGFYYLTEEKTAATVEIGSGLEVSLCLNGKILYGRYPITAGENVKLNICDHTSQGAIYSTKDDNGGYAVKVDGGTVNFYSGTLSGKHYYADVQNRAVLVASGSFTMYGGRIADGFVKDSKNGGNVLVQSGSFTVLGGEISGGAVTGGKGADIYMGAGTFTLGGSARAGQVYLSKDAAMGFADTVDVTQAAATVSMENSGTLLTNAQEGYLAVITNPDDSYTLEFDPAQNALYLKHKGHYHCVCVGSEHISDHSACQKVLWQPAPAVEDYKITITESGHYYLPQSEAATLVIEGEALTVDLCLNGFKLSGRTPVTVGEGVTLNICDHTGIGWIFSTKTDSTGYAVKVDGGTVNLYSGVLSGKHAMNATYNRPLYIASGIFNMYGGAIQNGKAKTNEHGGNVYLGGGSFTMHGGIIEKGYTNKHGGNICIQDGTFTMLGGIITGGTAGVKGGNVILLSDKDSKTARFILEGGTVEKGQAQNGGNICVNAVSGGSVLTVYGGSVEGGTASQKGANVFVYKSEGSVLELVTGLELTEVYLDTGKQITAIEPKKEEDAQ